MDLDLFAGPGGWSEAEKALGRHEVGIELDEAACSTRAAAGHETIVGDVAQLDPTEFEGEAEGLIASPPCPAFSVAGKGEGRDHLPALVDAVNRGDWSARPSDDPRVWLVLEVGRWIDGVGPEWVALEQVREVLPVWRAYRHRLVESGWSAWAGLIDAADYGVPQNRTRAVLIASRVRNVHPPAPTHVEGDAPSLFEQRAPWVSWGEALGLAGVALGFPRLDDTGTSADGYRERDWRDADEPSFALTEKARSWTLSERQARGATRTADEPAMTITASADNGNFRFTPPWAFERPATTVQGDPRLWPPGHKVNGDDRARMGTEAADERYGDRAGSDAIRLTIEQALVLQSFRRDYPVQGTKTKKFEQVGNAVPPLLARHIITAAAGLEVAST